MARTASTVEEIMAIEGTDQDEGVITTVEAPGDCQEPTEPSSPEPKSNTTQTPDGYKRKTTTHINQSIFKSCLNARIFDVK
jgi:hypothetical protein